MDTLFYIARMTHNYDNNWKKPSGPKYKSSDTKSAFEAKYKFGFEEWFQCERHELDGYQYAYIENLEAHHCKAKILLHTIRQNDGKEKNERRLVGVLDRCEYYTNWADGQLQAVANQFYEGMKKDLEDVLKAQSKELQRLALDELKRHKNYISEKGKPLFNVRYKKEDFQYIISKRIDSLRITKNNHFTIEPVTLDKLRSYTTETQQLLADLGLAPIWKPVKRWGILQPSLVIK